MGRPRNKGLGAAYASMSERFTTKSWRVTEGNCRSSWAATLVVGIGSERQRSAERNHVHFVQRRCPYGAQLPSGFCGNSPCGLILPVLGERKPTVVLTRCMVPTGYTRSSRLTLAGSPGWLGISTIL